MTFRLKQHNSQVIMSAILGLESKGCAGATVTQVRKYIFNEYTCHRSHDESNFAEIIYLTLESAVQNGYLVKCEDLYTSVEFESETFPDDILITDKQSHVYKRLQTRCLMQRLKIKDGQTLEELSRKNESVAMVRKRLEKGVHLGFISSENNVRRGKLYFRNIRKPDRGVICAPNYSLCKTVSKASSI